MALRRVTLAAITLIALLLSAGCAALGGYQAPAPGHAPAQASFAMPGERFADPDGFCYFLNQSMGWRLVMRDLYGEGEGVDLMKTDDGGRTWRETARADKDDPDANAGLPLAPPAGTIPFDGVKDAVTFLNPSTGWLAGTVSGDFLYAAVGDWIPTGPHSARRQYSGTRDTGVDWLYVTHDGGRTWRHQDIAVPASLGSAQIYVVPPAFFTARDGLLPVTFADADRYYPYLYFSHDGGRSWEAAVPAAGRGASGPLQWDYRDPGNQLVMAGGTTWQSRDGGYTWTKVSAAAGSTVPPAAFQVTPVVRPDAVAGQIVAIGYEVGQSIIYPGYGGYSVLANPGAAWTVATRTAFLDNHQARQDLKTFLASPYAASPEARQTLPDGRDVYPGGVVDVMPSVPARAGSFQFGAEGGGPPGSFLRDASTLETEPGGNGMDLAWPYYFAGWAPCAEVGDLADTPQDVELGFSWTFSGLGVRLYRPHTVYSDGGGYAWSSGPQRSWYYAFLAPGVLIASSTTLVTQTGTTTSCGADVRLGIGGASDYGFSLQGREGWGFRGIFGNSTTRR